MAEMCTPKMGDAVDSSALFQGYKAFYDCHELSDLTLTCGARKWKVHKLVMSANSTFFKNACTGEFKEAKDNTIELKEDEEHAVAAMIYYLYHGTYTAAVSKGDTVSEPVFHLHVYMTGDKYDVNGLSKLAKARLTPMLTSIWEQDAFADAVEAMYGTDLPDSYFRSIVLDITKKHYLELFADGTQYARFTQVARATPEFTFEVVRAIGGLSPSVRAAERPMEAPIDQVKPIVDLSDDELSEEEQTVQAMLDSLDPNAHGYRVRRTPLEARRMALARRRRFGQATPQATPVRQSPRVRR